MAQNKPQQDGGFKPLAAAAPTLPARAKDMGISEAIWTTLTTSIFPGAAESSVMAAWAYCQARQLDVLKRPCHIVPMPVRDPDTGQERWRDVIMPGISELRTTAMRTGLYLGTTEPEYGPEIRVPINSKDPDGDAITVPAWCRVTVLRWSDKAQREIAFPHTERITETVVRTKYGTINKMWQTRPIGQLTKCAEAGALRKGFPEELGGEATAEEMHGRALTDVGFTVEDASAAEAPAGQGRAPEASAQDLTSQIQARSVEDAPAAPEQLALPDGAPSWDQLGAQIGSIASRDDYDLARDALNAMPTCREKLALGKALAAKAATLTEPAE